jgi:hypothetical protein
MMLARLIRTVATIVVAVIVAAVLLRVLGANPHNVVVRDVHDVGQFLAGPFKGLFSVGGAKATMAVNWGIAAAVYLIVGHLTASLIARAAVRGRRWGRPVAQRRI